MYYILYYIFVALQCIKMQKKKKNSLYLFGCTSYCVLVDAVANHIKPCWSVERPIGSEREGTAGPDKLRMQTKATVELQQFNKLSPNGDLSPSEGPPSLPSSTQLPRKGQTHTHTFCAHCSIEYFWVTKLLLILNIWVWLEEIGVSWSCAPASPIYIMWIFSPTLETKTLAA